MRDRLIELFNAIEKDPAITCPHYKTDKNCDTCKYTINNVMCNHTLRMVDYLLENGVIVPPCKVGDKVYYVHETLWDNDYKNKVISESVKKRILKIVERPKHFTNLALEILTFDYCFIIDWLKGNIFLTKEEAEQALKERNNGTT